MTVKKRVQAILLDADGCLYNLRYQSLLISVVNQFWDFLRINHPDLTDQERMVNARKMEEIYQYIESFKFPDTNNTVITNKDLLKRLRSFMQLYKSEHQVELPMQKAFIEFTLELMDKEYGLTQKLLSSIVLRANEVLLKQIAKRAVDMDIDVLMVLSSSNRQSYMLDRAGIAENGTNSFHLDLVAITDQLEYEFKKQSSKEVLVSHVPFSMSDFYGNLKRGESYKNVMLEFLECFSGADDSDLIYKHADYLFDDTKFSVSYAAMHAVATHTITDLRWSKNQEVEFIVDMFDDLKENILDVLAPIYTTNPELIPENMHFNLHHHQGHWVEQPIASVKGTGIVDKCYDKTILELVAEPLKQSRANDMIDSVDVARMLKVDELLKIRARQVTSIYQANSSAPLYKTKSPEAMTSFIAEDKSESQHDCNDNASEERSLKKMRN